MTSATELVETALSTGAGLAQEFCNDPQKKEWHALTYGFFAGWSKDDPSCKFDANNIPDYFPQSVKDAILEEHPYYNAGWFIGWNASKRWVQVSGVIGLLIVGYLTSKGWL